MNNERRLDDGRIELIDTRRVEASPLYNEDLAPVPLARVRLKADTTYDARYNRPARKPVRTL